MLVIDSAKGGRIQMVTWGYRCEEEENESEGSLEVSFWTCLILRSFYEPSKAVCQAGNCRLEFGVQRQRLLNTDRNLVVRTAFKAMRADRII